MKGGFAAVALAAMAGGASAVNHRHAHELFAHKRGAEAKTCGCTTIWTTTTGEATWVPNPPPATSAAPTTSSSSATPTSTVIVPVTTSTEKLPVPTPEPITCPTPGTYTFSATTVTLSETTTVCGASKTSVTPGTHTVGGVTTVVETATTVTCPVATVTTKPNGVVHSTLTSTEYVCPSAGTYTIAPITTTVTVPCEIDVPVPTSYNPGTYTAPEKVITVTEENFVTVCPYESVKPTPKPLPSPKPEQPKPKPQPKPEPKPQPKPSPKPEQPTTPSVGGNGNGAWALTYNPYNPSSGGCLSGSDVDRDIANMAKLGIKTVRTYSTDCSTLEHVGAACKKHGVKMMVGVFINESGCSANSPDVKEQLDALSKWDSWDLVELFVIGNEALFNGYCSASELAELVQTAKKMCSKYTGPITVAETLDQWQNSDVSGALCDIVDITGGNLQPFFNAQTTASQAGKFVKNQLDLLGKICPGKEAMNLECGWPKKGSSNGAAIPGVKEQAEALTSIIKEAGDKVVMFANADELWKGGDESEKSFGVEDFLSNLL